MIINSIKSVVTNYRLELRGKSIIGRAPSIVGLPVRSLVLLTHRRWPRMTPLQRSLRRPKRRWLIASIANCRSHLGLRAMTEM